jgi:ABC-type transport system involved in cytochrome bd biosynthesis fused ATPase/permease subunit
VPALDDFYLFAPAGSRVALVGPSGAGKSSVLAALLGFAPHSAGRMSVNGRERADFTAAEWRAHFSWVPQRPYLFTATLAENLRLGDPAATPESLVRVIGAVGLDHLVAHLPTGIDTPLGQDGLTLSAGERQRVALARALLRPAPILLLDEPSASLDPPTLERITPAIEPWLAGRTVLVAAHEPVLLPHFDAVIEVATPVPTAVGQ